MILKLFSYAQFPFADSYMIPLTCSLPLEISRHYYPVYIPLSSTPPHIPYSKFSLKSCAGPFLFLVYTFFLDKLIQTLRLNTHSHLMTSRPSSPALTPFLNSRAPIRHAQNQSSSFSQTHITCLRLMEPPSCGSRPQVHYSSPLHFQSAQFYLHNGSLSSRRSLCIPATLYQEFPCLYFSQFIAHNAHSYFLALFRFKSQCLLLMFKTPVVWTQSTWPTSFPTVCLQPGVLQLHSCPISEKLRHTNTFLLRLFLLP